MKKCINCTNNICNEYGEHKCLFDPPYNICDCCTGKDYKMTLNDEAQLIVGTDGGLDFV